MAEEFLKLEPNASNTEVKSNKISVTNAAFFKSTPFIVGAILASILVLLAVLAWLFFGNNDGNANSMNDQIQAEISKKDALYVAMPRPFLFNLPGSERVALVEIKVQLMVRGSEHELLVKKHIPLIEDALLTTFSSSDLQRLSSQSGKDAMRQLALRHLHNTLQPVTGKKIIEKLLFTGFIIQ